MKSRQPHYFSSLSLCLSLLLLLGTTSHAFQWDKDTLEEGDCALKTKEECISSSKIIWFSCPIHCASLMEMDGYMSQVEDPDETLYDIKITLTSAGGGDATTTTTTLSAQDVYEGYVGIFAVLPLYSGMASYYLQMLEHVQSIFPYTVSIVVLPLMVASDDQQDDAMSSSDISLPKGSKLRMAPISKTGSTKFLNALVDLPPAAGPENVAASMTQETLLHMDRPTVFLISSQGTFVERLICPNINVLERRIQVYLTELNQHHDREL